ncbi:FAD:protein FMN transferase [Miniphocaeibacter massiliensis]|uniref:FAD:protein FMN transferase n=1 Tax=Miniphocaeibacter massiliensis TaxID=2041841 RepID=UPI000C1BF866|nr:FAD:protein FMN transferase [Miniphocaeibacter massiliensis]
MRKIIKLPILFIIAIISITSCNNKEYTKYDNTFYDAFDTIIVFTAYTKTDEEFNKYYDIVKNEFERLHKLYNQYDSFKGINNIKTINENAGIKAIKVDKDIINLLKFSKDMSEKYSNKTNIAFGSVLEIWHEYRTEGLNKPENAKLPNMEDLKKASEYIDLSKVIIDEKNSTVFLKDKNMALDIGATSKGYASQLVIDKVKEEGCISAILNAGGNILSVGKPEEKGKYKWSIGIQNPNSEMGDTGTSNTDIVYANDISVVTSGDYQRYYEVEGKRYNHIIDPSTLMPADKFKSVTVLSKDSGVADFFSTTLFMLSLEEGKELLEKVEDVEAIWIDKNNKITTTNGMKQYLKSKGAKAISD